MNAQYFINKFEAIPEEKWCSFYQINDAGQRCALGHFMPEDATSADMYGHTTDEGIAAGKLFKGLIVETIFALQPEYQGQLNIAVINNGEAPEYQQFTPKQRILAALRDIQTKEQQDKAVDVTKEVLSQPITELV